MNVNEFNELSGMNLYHDCACSVTMSAINELWCENDEYQDKQEFVNHYIGRNVRRNEFWSKVCNKADETSMYLVRREREHVENMYRDRVKKLEDENMQLKIERLQMQQDLRAAQDKLQSINRIINE